MAPFQPTYIFENELTAFGLPTPPDQPDIMNLVGLASSLIDEACGRIDGDGNGSLVFTTYTQRLLLQTRNRNLIQLPLKPIVGLTTATVSDLAASGAMNDQNNPYYTGVQANTITRADGTLSGIWGASGRYGYTRQDMSIAYPDLFSFINPLNLLTMFGGPAPFIPIDIANMDYDSRTGEVWIPAGLQLQRYSEVVVIYNSGYDPRNMPRAIKHATAAVVKNALGKGAGTTGLLTMTLGRSGANASFTESLIDQTVEILLRPFLTVRAY